MKQLNLNYYSNPLMLTPAEKEIIAEYKLSQNNIYEDVFPAVANPDNYEMSTLLDAPNPTYNSIREVIQALAEVEENQTLSKDEQEHAAAQVYAHMSEEVHNNRDDMLALTAYRPDAMLWAPHEMINTSFLQEAIQYNPLAFHLADECVPSTSSLIDTYRDVLFGEGHKQHPVLEDMGIHKEFTPLISPKCDMDTLCFATHYRDAFKKVLLDQPGHTPYIDMDKHIVKTSPTIDFLVLCEQYMAQEALGTTLSGLELEDFMDDRISAYNEVRNQLEPLAVRNSLVRENLAEFGYQAIVFQNQYEPLNESQRVVPETSWMLEYQKYQHKVQMHDTQRLYDLNLQMEQDKQFAPGTQGNTYPQSYIYEMREIHGRMPVDAMNAQMDVAAFWQDVGQAVVDARLRIKNNDYPQNAAWTRQNDRVFINEVKETFKANPQKQFIRDNINQGIHQMKEQYQQNQQKEEHCQEGR